MVATNALADCWHPLFSDYGIRHGILQVAHRSYEVTAIHANYVGPIVAAFREGKTVLTANSAG